MAGLLGSLTGQIRIDVRQAVSAYATVRAQNQKTVYALRGAGDSFLATGKSFAAAGGLILYGVGQAVNSAAEFERKMDYVGAVTDTTGKKMKQLSDYALQLAQDTIYSGNEIADGFVELAKAGVSADQIIHGVGKAMASLGAAADIPLAQSGQYITSTLAQFDLGVRGAAHVADVLAGAANASIADVTDIGYSLKYVGGIAHTAGLKFDDVATAISILAKAGIKGSTAGTTLRQMIVSLPGNTDAARGALAELGIITEDGTNRFYDQAGALKPLSQVYQILGTALKGYTAEQKTVLLRTIFQTRALSSAAILSRAGAKGFKEMYGEMSKVKAANVASERLDNLSGDVEILRGNIETLITKAGQPLQNMLRGYVKQATKLVQAFAALSPQTQELILKTLLLAGVGLTLIGIFNIIIGTILKFAANMLLFGKGLKFVFTIVSAVVRAFAAFDIIGAINVLLGALAGALGISVGWLLLIIAAVAAVVIGFIIWYKHSERLRKIVHAVGNALKAAGIAVYKFLKLLATDPGAAWDKIKAGAAKLWDYIKKFVKSVPGLLKRGFFAAVRYGKQAFLDLALKIGEFELKMLGKLKNFVAKLASYFTFKNVLKALVFFSTLGIRLFLLLVRGILRVVVALLPKLFKLFNYLLHHLGYIIGFLVGRAIRLWFKLQSSIIRLTIRLVKKVPGLILRLLKLLGRLWLRLVNFAINQFVRLVRALPGLARKVKNAVVSELKALPGQVYRLFVRLGKLAVKELKALPGQLKSIAVTIGTAIIEGIKGLPGLVKGILQDVIQAFLDVVKQGYESAKSFAGGLWSGFKDGLGINSPSFIEKHMVQMNKTIATETKALKRHTLRVQGVGRKFVKDTMGLNAQLGVPDAFSSVTTRRLQNQYMVSQGSVSVEANLQRRKKNGPLDVSGQLTLTPDSRAMIRGVAVQAHDDDRQFDDVIDRMNP